MARGSVGVGRRAAAALKTEEKKGARSSGPLDLGACLAPRYPGYAGGGRAHLTQVRGWGWGAGDTRLRKGRRLGRELGGLALAESHFPAPRPLLEGAGAQGPLAKVAA